MTTNDLSAVQASAINDLGATVVMIAIDSQWVLLGSTWFADHLKKKYFYVKVGMFAKTQPEAERCA